MKKILFLLLLLASLNSFSQQKKDSAKIDSVIVYQFTEADLNVIFSNINKEVYKKGWENFTLTDIANYFVGTLYQNKKYIYKISKK